MALIQCPECQLQVSDKALVVQPDDQITIVAVRTAEVTASGKEGCSNTPRIINQGCFLHSIYFYSHSVTPFLIVL